MFCWDLEMPEAGKPDFDNFNKVSRKKNAQNNEQFFIFDLMKLAPRDKVLGLCSLVHAMSSFLFYLGNVYFPSRVHAGISSSGRPAPSPFPSPWELHTAPLCPGTEWVPALAKHLACSTSLILLEAPWGRTLFLFLLRRWGNRGLRRGANLSTLLMGSK